MNELYSISLVDHLEKKEFGRLGGHHGFLASQETHGIVGD